MLREPTRDQRKEPGGRGWGGNALPAARLAHPAAAPALWCELTFRIAFQPDFCCLQWKTFHQPTTSATPSRHWACRVSVLSTQNEVLLVSQRSAHVSLPRGSFLGAPTLRWASLDSQDPQLASPQPTSVSQVSILGFATCALSTPPPPCCITVHLSES